MKIELKDYLDSGLAKRYGLDNFPSFCAVYALDELTKKILTPLTDSIERSIGIPRGFMCEKLNSLVGCQDTLHVKGHAADVVPLDGNLRSLIAQGESWLKDNDIPFDESKEEIDNNGNHYWHIALYGENGEQRRQFSEQ